MTGAVSTALKERLSPYGEFAFLMGSAETARFNAESDIDVAIFWKTSCVGEKRLQLIGELAQKLGRDLDVIALNDVDVIFARQVLETGRLLFNNSPGLLLNWKMEQMSAYPDFKFTRKIIEDNILKRKKYV